jgi:hypothetical protein
VKSSCKRLIRFNTILAFCLVSVGLLANQWLITCLLSPDGVIALENTIFIWAFQSFCIVTAVLVFLKGNTREERKRLVFGFVLLGLMIITLEISLHIAHFIIRLASVNFSQNLEM